MAERDENVNYPTKNWLTTLILCWFLGFLGLHHFYAGKIGSGALLCYCSIVSGLILSLNAYLGLASFVIVGGVVVYEFALIALKKFKDCYGREIVNDKI